MEEANANDINKMLLREFGTFEASPKALFRVVLANDTLTEVRSGEHAEWYGDILLRATIGTMRSPKYTYLDNVYVLERQYGANDDAVKDGDGYEPIFVFYNRKREIRLPLRYDVCKIYALLSIAHKPVKTEKMIQAEEEARVQRVFDKRMDILQQELSDLSHLFHHKEAVILGASGETLPASPNLRGAVK